ncbi:MAG: hypothetical protein GXP59_10260 [Deltaproteobacteria bacterium]|nr:hypothetical protein [Deltaproteobacteria bacterium]
MIRDFSNSFDGRQCVKIKSIRVGGSQAFRKIMGILLAGTMLVGLVSSVAFTFLIRSGLDDLAGRQADKLELLSIQRDLYQQRKSLLAKGHIIKMAGHLGLYSATKNQVVSRF